MVILHVYMVVYRKANLDVTLLQTAQPLLNVYGTGWRCEGMIFLTVDLVKFMTIPCVLYVVVIL